MKHQRTHHGGRTPSRPLPAPYRGAFRLFPSFRRPPHGCARLHQRQWPNTTAGSRVAKAIPQKPSSAAESHGHSKRGGPTAAKATSPSTSSSCTYSPRVQMTAIGDAARWRLPRRGLSREELRQRPCKERPPASASSSSTRRTGPVRVILFQSVSLPPPTMPLRPPPVPPHLHLLNRSAGGG